MCYSSCLQVDEENNEYLSGLGKSILSANLTLQRTCSICQDDTFLVSDGVECSNGHFICTPNGCFDNYIKGASEDSSRAVFEKRGGQIYCFLRETQGLEVQDEQGCQGQPFTDKAIAMHTEDCTFQALLAARLRTAETKARNETEKQMRAEFEKLQRMSEHERAVHRARQHITDGILNHACIVI